MIEETHADVEYWGLTRAQAARHYARVARMLADRSQFHAQRAVRYARQAEIGSWITIGLLALSLALRLLAAVLP